MPPAGWRVSSVSSFLAWVIVTIHPGVDSNVFALFSFDIEGEEDEDPERDLDLFFLGVDSFEDLGVSGIQN